VWLTAGLQDAGFETLLVTGRVASGEGDMSYFARKYAVEPLLVPEMGRDLGLRDLIVTLRLIRLLFRLKPRIVHTHKAKAGAVGRTAALVYKWMTPSILLGRPRDCKVVHTYHGHVFHSYFGRAKTRFFLAIERALARISTDVIITISEQQRDEISGRYHVGRPEQFRVVPLGIDLEQAVLSAGRLRAEFGIAGDEFLIGIVGRLCEVKNHAMLLRAAAKLIARGVPLRIVVIGDGHLRTELVTLTRELDIESRVIFAGFRTDATVLYPDLDLVALTSLNEGTPLTLIEAMSCGRPVAATRVGGVIDIMGRRRSDLDGFSVWEHGVTAAADDDEGFARAVEYLVGRPELREEMGRRGREFVLSKMSKERLIKDVGQLYRELCGVKAPAPSEAAAVLKPN
jgi:glycosyltransferase involved in cell wall biosynthesis